VTDDETAIPTPPQHRFVGRLRRVLGADDALPIDPDLAPDDAASPSPTHRATAVHHHRGRPRVLAVIALGGFLGTLARYGVGRAWPTAAGHFPTATFAINTSGAFLLGLFLAGMIERRPASPVLRPFIATGLLGGWTTYSTFSVDIVSLTKGGDALEAGEYLLLSLAAGLVAVAAGIALGRRRTRAPAVGNRPGASR
jgi:fluoride exporter